MRVLVTGASGFIGSRLASALVAQGISVRGTYRHQHPEAPGVEWWRVRELDLPAQWPALLAQTDAVVHLAALVHQTGAARPGWVDFERANVGGTRALARASRAAATRRIVFLSSISVHGRATAQVDEQAPLAPEDDYGRSKLLAERALEEELADGTTDWCVLRPPLVYGHGAPGNMPRLQRLAARGLPLPFGAVRNRRSFMHVDNLVDAVITVLAFPAPIRASYVLSDGSDFATAEVLRVLAAGAGRPLRLLNVPERWLRLLGRAGDLATHVLGTRAIPGSREIDSLVGSLWVDSTRFRAAFGWQPRLPGVDAFAASYGAQSVTSMESR